MENFKRGVEPKAAMGIGHSEKIGKILKNVLEVTAIYFDDPNGPYTATCPFCGDRRLYGGGVKDPTMEDLSHDENCAYKLAREIAE